MPSTRRFRSTELVNAVRAVMDTMERRYQKAFLKQVEAMVSGPQMKALLKAVSSPGATITPSVMQMIDSIGVDQKVLINLSRQALASGGSATARAVGFTGRFDLNNPRAIQLARTIGAETVTGVSRAARQRIRDIVVEAVEGIITPQEAAMRIRNEVGLTPEFAQAVEKMRQTNIAAGMPKVQANKLANQYAERLLRTRAETIARTEIARAVSAGQHEFWKQMQDDGELPPTAVRVWITAKDERTCDLCAPMNGLTAPIDGFWQTARGDVSIPQEIHPRCRCTSGIVFPDKKLKKNDEHGYELWLITKHSK